MECFISLRKLDNCFGQTKLPGNNQRVVSSGSLEFTDRTINNSRFNIDRDFGLFLDFKSQIAFRTI
jgi:hypothetical protein